MKMRFAFAAALAFAAVTGCGGSSAHTTKITSTQSNLTTTAETKIK